MAKWNYRFRLVQAEESARSYRCEKQCARIDFLSESCLRVALYTEGQVILPTFCVNPTGGALPAGRDKLSTQGFPLYRPQVEVREGTEHFYLANGVEVHLQTDGFLLSYLKEGKPLFADREPLAYNFGGEFGTESYHYLTRSEGEVVFGLGDKGGALNKAGRAFRIETTDCMGYDAAESDPLYKHIPFYICENATGCYGIFYDTAANAYMDFGKEINNYYPPYKYFKGEEKALVYYVFFGSKFSVLRQFASLAGKQAFPPRRSFDYCASTMAYTDAPDAEKHFDTFLEELDKYVLSCSGFYLSSGYTSIGNKRYVFHWDTDKFPHPKQFAARMREKGIRLIPNIKPAFLDTHPLYAALAEQGLFIQNADGSPFITRFWDGMGSYLDFTNPQAVRFWQEQVQQQLLALGITATWNDNNEFDIRDPQATVFGFGGGKVPAREIKPDLSYLMVAASYAAQVRENPRLRPFLSTRSGGIGVRRLAQTWSGDNRSEFKDLRYCHNIGLTMSLSGLSFYGHDLGGFHGDMPSPELLLRWLQHGIFEPRFTIHSWNADGSATMPWSYPEQMPAVKGLFAQRKRLLPYLYNCAYRAVEEEIPMNAPPVLYYKDKKLYAQNDTMLIGTDILAGFVFDEGKAETAVYLPAGEGWYLGDKLYEGGKSVTVPLPAQARQVPFFVRAGSVIASDEGGLRLTVYPRAKGSFESSFFWDDGESFRYLENDCVRLKMRVQCGEKTVRLSYRNEGNMPFSPVFCLCAGDKRALLVEEQLCE